MTLLFFSNLNNLRVERNDVQISIDEELGEKVNFLLAVIADTHLDASPKTIIEFKNLLEQVISHEPDLVVFVGDYSAPTLFESQHEVAPEQIISSILAIAPIPLAIVFGNHEYSTDANLWRDKLNKNGLKFLENEVDIIETKSGAICVRGLGDKYSGKFRFVEYPPSCSELPKVTITHDPAGAFDADLRGLIISGHTHCGQISLPLVGPLWVPSSVPRDAYCGIFQDDIKTVFVSSGVGTSFLPVRFGTQSQWDLVEVSYY